MPELSGAKLSDKLSVLNMHIDSLKHQLSKKQQIITDDVYYNSNVKRLTRNIEDFQAQLAEFVDTRAAGLGALVPLQQEIDSLRQQKVSAKNQSDMDKFLELQRLINNEQ